MGLLERALLIKEIDQSFQTIENNDASLNEKVKAETHLKKIRDNEQLDLDLVQPPSPHIQAKAVAQNFLHTTQFQSSYRGFFTDENTLKQALEQIPEYGWAILYTADQQWQAWLISQPHKPAIHSSLKAKIEDTFSWVLLQKKLFKCLNEDEISIQHDHASETLSTQKNHLIDNKVSLAQQVKTAQIIQLDEYNVEIHSLDYMPAFTDQLFQMQFTHLSTAQYADFFYFKTINQAIIHSPIYIAEQIDQQGKFIKYLVLFGISNIEQTSNLLNALSEHQQRWISSIRNTYWLNLKDHFQSFEQLFECFTEKSLPIWQKEKKFPFIPASLLKTHKIISFEEDSASLQTPLILLNDNQKYRVVHGVQRLNFTENERAYPFIQYHRNHEINWKTLQVIIQHLPPPVTSVELHNAIEHFIAQSK